MTNVQHNYLNLLKFCINHNYIEIKDRLQKSYDFTKVPSSLWNL